MYKRQPFLHQMVYSVVDLMKDAYPELVDAADRVARVVKEEETRFARTLDVGLEKLEQDFQPLRAEKFLAEHPSRSLEEVKKIFGERVTSDWGLSLIHICCASFPPRFARSMSCSCPRWWNRFAKCRAGWCW